MTGADFTSKANREGDGIPCNYNFTPFLPIGGIGLELDNPEFTGWLENDLKKTNELEPNLSTNTRRGGSSDQALRSFERDMFQLEQQNGPGGSRKNEGADLLAHVRGGIRCHGYAL